MAKNAFPKIWPNFSANPLFNYLIVQVLGVSKINQKVHKYQAAMQELGSRELATFIDIALADLGINWQLVDLVGETQQILLSKRPTLLVSNHPLGGRDGMALLACFNQLYGTKHFKALVNEFLLDLPYLKDLFLPINPLKMRSSKMQQLHGLNQALQGGDCKALLFFSAGLCSRWHKTELSLQEELAQYGRVFEGQAKAIDLGWKPLHLLRDLPWRHSFLRLARKHQLNILPLHISGRNSTRFYRLARLRQRLGLRFNWEMLLLPREFLNARSFTGRPEPNKTNLCITAGELLRAEQIALWSPQHDDLWAQMCKHYVYQLPHWQDRPNLKEIDKLHQSILQLQGDRLES